MQQDRPATPVLAAPQRLGGVRSRLSTSRRTLIRNPNMAAGLFILILASVLAIFASQIGGIGGRSPVQSQALDRLEPPSSRFWFGTDGIGRSVYSRSIHGTRLSLTVGASVATVTMIAGAVIGTLSGYYRRLDDIIMRFMDGLMAIPGFLLALSLVALLGPSVQNVVIAISVADTPGIVRIVRSSVLSLREQQFIDAAKAIGANPVRILARHIFPQLVGPLIVQGTFIFALAILNEAGLSFLGAGVPPHVPSWGNMMGENRLYMQVAVWTVFFPGLFVAITVLGVNLVGDGLRDNLDPRLRRRM
jgi:peptide/nickel transport system permease protein